MELITILNRCHRFRGFVYQHAHSLRQHRELILNYFRAQKLISSGVVEGLNNKAKVTMRKSYGFRSRNQPTIPSDESEHQFSVRFLDKELEAIKTPRIRLSINHFGPGHNSRAFQDRCRMFQRAAAGR